MVTDSKYRQHLYTVESSIATRLKQLSHEPSKKTARLNIHNASLKPLSLALLFQTLIDCKTTPQHVNHRKMPTWDKNGQTSSPRAQAISIATPVPADAGLHDGVPVITQGTTEPVSRGPDGVEILDKSVPYHGTVFEKEMPRAVSSEHEQRRGRRPWRFGQGQKRCKSESPSGSAKGQREEGSGRLTTASSRSKVSEK